MGNSKLMRLIVVYSEGWGSTTRRRTDQYASHSSRLEVETVIVSLFKVFVMFFNYLLHLMWYYPSCLQ